MTKESDLLDDIFGTAKTWRDHRVRWCDMCETYIICCDKCTGSSCNCMSCESCSKNQGDFNALKPWPDYYMTDAERKVVQKYRRIKHLLETCLIENKSGLDINWLYRQGALCENDWELLDLTLPRYPEDVTLPIPEIVS